MRSNISFVLIFILSNICALIDANLHCFVCNSIDSEKCKEFDVESELTFIMECPKNSKSCGLQMEGNKTIRSCELTELNDCKWANGVQYCYCRHNLCNKEPIIPSDDEDDYLEGSGIRTSTISYTIAATVSSSSSSNHFFIPLNMLPLLSSILCL